VGEDSRHVLLASSMADHGAGAVMCLSTLENPSPAATVGALPAVLPLSCEILEANRGYAGKYNVVRSGV